MRHWSNVGLLLGSVADDSPSSHQQWFFVSSLKADLPQASNSLSCTQPTLSHHNGCLNPYFTLLFFKCLDQPFSSQIRDLGPMLEYFWVTSLTLTRHYSTIGWTPRVCWTDLLYESVSHDFLLQSLIY